MDPDSPLRPVDEAVPHWTVREIASHFDISIGLTLALIEGQDDVQPARDRTSFSINPRSETAPVVYEYAYLNLAGYGKDPIDERVVQTFEQTISRCRTTAPDLVGPGYFAPMRLDEFVASRIVEAVVHADPRHPGARQISGRRAGRRCLHRPIWTTCSPTYRWNPAARWPMTSAWRACCFGTCRPR